MKASIDFAAFGAKALDEFKVALRGAYDSWSDEDKKLVVEALETAAKAMAFKIAGEDEKARKERDIANATLKNVSVAITGGIALNFWQSVSRVVTLAAKSLVFG